MTNPLSNIDLTDREPAVREIVSWFAYAHLPEGPVQDASALVSDLAAFMLEDLPDSRELEVGLRKLLEAKDAFVRCAVAANR